MPQSDSTARPSAGGTSRLRGTGRRHQLLLAAAALLRPRLPRVLAAIALGVLSLASALALAG